MKIPFSGNKQRTWFSAAMILLAIFFATGTFEATAGSSGCSLTVTYPDDDTSGGTPINHAVAIGGGDNTAGQLKFGGNGMVTGECGGVHTNGDLTFSGCNVILEGDVTYSGNDADNSCDDITPTPADPIEVPEINANDFIDYVDYQFKADGTVWEATGGTGPYTYTLVADSSSNKFKGWKLQQEKWTLQKCDTDCISGASIFVDGSVNMSVDNPPQNLTIIATGSIDFNSKTEISLNPNNHPNIGNIFMLANKDIDWTGLATNTIEGIMAAGEQIDFTGQGLFNGCIFTNGNTSTAPPDTNTVIGNGGISCNSEICKWPSVPEDIILPVEPF